MTRRSPLLARALALAGVAAASVATAAASSRPVASSPAMSTVRYHVTVDAAMRALSVEVCTRDAVDRVRFGAPDADALPAVEAVTRSSGGAIARRGTSVEAADWQARECLRYRVPIAAATSADRRASSEPFVALDDDLVTRPSAWLLRPGHLARADDATITFDLPPALALSVPWQPLDAEHATFRVGPTSAAWPALVAVGRFDDAPVAVGAGSIRPAVLGRTSADQARTLRAYAAATANDVAATFPRVFAMHPQVAMLATGSSREAIPFGESYRGGSSALVLYVDPSHPLDAYFDNWTLTHELVHLVHPYLGDDGRWISEGIATYYQNVLRARAGRVSANEAWRSLDAGFARGLADRDDRTVFGTAAGSGHYMRVYWSGAALALRADVAWRTRRARPTSLDAVLNAYLACCRTLTMQSPRAFLAELDRLAGGEPVAVPLFEALGSRVEFPDVGAAYATLGLSSRGEPVGPNAVRDAIMKSPRVE